MKRKLSDFITPTSQILADHEKAEARRKRDIEAYTKDHPDKVFIRFEDYNGYADKKEAGE